MSLYADYAKETEDVDTLENESGFVTYQFVSPEECYLINIYVVPEKRRSRVAWDLVDAVAGIAKQHGCKYISGTVIPSKRGSNESLKAHLAYGFRLLRSEQNKIWFIKELS